MVNVLTISSSFLILYGENAKTNIALDKKGSQMSDFLIFP